jgi:hypothetical protein
MRCSSAATRPTAVVLVGQSCPHPFLQPDQIGMARRRQRISLDRGLQSRVSAPCRQLLAAYPMCQRGPASDLNTDQSLPREGGRCMDNIFVERLWRSLDPRRSTQRQCECSRDPSQYWSLAHFYNEERQHQSLGYHTPRQSCEESLWIRGRSALPTGSASPVKSME